MEIIVEIVLGITDTTGKFSINQYFKINNLEKT